MRPVDRWTHIASLFRRDERGAIAILFALLLVPMLAVMGGALDVATAQRVKIELQSIAERAAQAGVADLADPERGARRVLENACGTGECGAGSAAGTVTVLFDEEPPRVSVRLEAEVPTNFLGLIGRKTFDVAGEGLAFVPVRGRPLAKAMQSPRSRRTLRDIERGKPVKARAVRDLRKSAGLPDR